MTIYKYAEQQLLACDKCIEEDNFKDRDQAVQEIINIKEMIDSRKFAERYKNLNMGRRFESATFEGYEPVNGKAAKYKGVCERFAANFQEFKKRGTSLVMCGAPGTGKNHLAAAICKAVIDHGEKAVHTTAIKLVRRVKETWGAGKQETEQEAIDLFVEPALLVIDEVGVQFGSQAEQIILMEVINSRYADMRPTILISNLSAGELEMFIGPQIVDRFYDGNSGVLYFDWQSYRRRVKT